MLIQRLQQHFFSRFIYLYAVMGSLLLAIIMLGWQQPFNSDGVIYLHAAAVYQQNGLGAALKVHGWPFMSIVIAWLSTLTHLSLLQAAYLFNFMTDTLTIVAALALASAFDYSRRQQALLLLLLLIFPWFNHLREHILRGHGYYAAGLFALLLFIHHARQPRLLWATGFTIMAMVATLFRIEGVVILLLAPLILPFACQGGIGRRCWALLSCYLLPILFGLFSVVMMAVIWHHGHGSGQYIRMINNDVLQPLHRPWGAFIQTSHNIAHDILPFHSTQDSVWLLAGGLVAMLLRQIILALGGVYFILGLYTLCQRPLLKTRCNAWVITAWLLLTLLIGAVFIAEQFFLSRRYIGLFVLIIVLILPRGISQFYTNYRGKRWCQHLFTVLLVLMLLYNATATVWHFGPSKRYIITAGRWIHRQLPPQARVYIIDPQLAYYAGRPQATAVIVPIAAWSTTVCRQYDYIAVKFPRKSEALMAAWGQKSGKPIITVGQHHKGGVTIFACSDSVTATGAK